MKTVVPRGIKKISPPRSYEALLERVRETIARGRLKARKALEEIQARMFWETGRWIHLYLKHEKKTGSRAPYGEKVVPKLAEDLTYDKTYLYDSLNVYRNNPIFRALGKLPVTHHRLLLQITDETQRKALKTEAEKGGWSSRQLAGRIRVLQGLPEDGRAPKVPSFRLIPRKGKLRHYRIAERNGRLFVDLGFRDFREITKLALGFKEGEIVEGASLDRLTKKPAAQASNLYTYEASLLDFPDADTYWIFIDKGFESFRREKIRLRGIDAPEISTPEGRAAREFVKGLLSLPEGEKNKAGAPYREVLVTTTKITDKWDRYLADLYFEKDGEEIYLNQLLLDSGHAVPYEE